PRCTDRAGLLAPRLIQDPADPVRSCVGWLGRSPRRPGPPAGAPGRRRLRPSHPDDRADLLAPRPGRHLEALRPGGQGRGGAHRAAAAGVENGRGVTAAEPWRTVSVASTARPSAGKREAEPSGQTTRRRSMAEAVPRPK